MDTTFPHVYECEELSTSSNSALPHYYYPGASLQGGRDGVLLEVRPNQGTAWLGTFEFGHISGLGVSGVFSTPDPGMLCVVSLGNGYLVSSEDPTSWQTVRSFPILHVWPLSRQRILLFADYTTLTAYGRAGLRWRTSQLAWDSLEVTDITDEFATGQFWDYSSDTMGAFRVDLATGSHEGGVPLPRDHARRGRGK